MPYATQDIRNIALVGQAGAGKTLLAEALLAQSGAIRSKGSLARGTTVCDFDPQEKALLHSLDTAICGFETQGKRVNIIDTPGYPDFLGRTLSALEAVETAVIVVSAVNGVEPMTQRMMDFAKTRGLCRLIVVNKIDSREARTEEVLDEIRATFGKACLPLNLPADGGAAVVDCFFQGTGKADRFFVGRGGAHRDHRPGRRGGRKPDGALPRARRGDHARATARSVRAGVARRSPRADLLLLRRNRRGHSRTAAGAGAARAEPGRGQPAAVPERRRRSGRARHR